MAVKIRLARRGRKDYPVYSIVIADARAPRDGRFIQKIGTYNPNQSPSQVNIEFELLYKWLSQGAQPTETVESICSGSGIMLLRHLAEGIQKGAITVAVAKKRFADWHKAKTASPKKKFTAIASLVLADAIFQKVDALPKKGKPKSALATKPKKKTVKKQASAENKKEAPTQKVASPKKNKEGSTTTKK